MRLTKRDVDNGDAVKCEQCGTIILCDEAYPHEFYTDTELTEFYEDILYCENCAERMFTKEEFEHGSKKEYAYLK